MTVYDGAVRIQDKDGRELQAWRVVFDQPGVGLNYTTVIAPDGAKAAERAQALAQQYRNRTVSTAR